MRSSPRRQARLRVAAPALAFAVVVGYAVAGCTKHAATPATTVVAITLRPTPAATATPVPATAVPTTAVPTTPAPTETATVPNTTAPTTTSARAQAEADVRAAVDRAQKVYLDCLALTPHCDVSVLDSAERDPLLSAAKQKLQSRNAKGYAARNLESAHDVVKQVSFPTGVLTEAEATVCTADSIVIYAPGKAPGGADLIIDDTTISSTATWHLRLDTDGVWRAYDITDATPSEATDTCV